MRSCKNIIDNSPLPMAATEGSGHTLVAANSAFCRLSGVTAADIIGRPMREAITGEGSVEVCALLDRVYTGSTDGVNRRLRYSAGETARGGRQYTAWALGADDSLDVGIVLQVSEIATALTGPPAAYEALHTLNRDIRDINERLVMSSVRHQALADLAVESEGRLRTLLHGLDAVVCEIDGVTGRFTFLNERAESYLGYSIDRWNEDDFWKQVVHPDDYAKAQTAFRMEGTARDGLQYAFRVTTASGSVLWLRNFMTVVRDGDGEIVKRRCVIVDATEEQSSNEVLALELERNRSIAEAMQYSILWHHPENTFAGLTIAAFYEPAAGDALVGGDFVDAFKLANRSVMLVVGDVTGKGLKAATRTVEARYALRAFAHESTDPSEAMSRLNEFLYDSHIDDDEAGNALIVMSLIVLDPVSGTAQIASAGAERPLILRHSGEVEEVHVGGLILGIDRDAVYTNVAVTIEAGETLLMTTDGILEARRGADFFGYEGLYRTVRANSLESPRVIGQELLDAARAHSGGRLTDDACLLVVRRDAA